MKTGKQDFVVQSAELSELAEEWLGINWRKIVRDIFKMQQNVFLLTTMPQVMEEIVVKVVLSVFMDVYSHILTIVNSPTTLPPLEILK